MKKYRYELLDYKYNNKKENFDLNNTEYFYNKKDAISKLKRLNYKTNNKHLLVLNSIKWNNEKTYYTYIYKQYLYDNIRNTIFELNI